MKGSLDIVVIGAGIGGLGSALTLSTAGHRVTVIERDDTPMPDDVEGAFEWDRRGVPQTRHPHAFLGLARTILRDRYPDVLHALRANGVADVAMGDAPPFPLADEVRQVLAADDDLKLLACRRTTFEWVLRRCVLAEPNVSMQVGRGVARLRSSGATSTGVPLVCGVVLDDGTELGADLVVVSSGRRGDLPAWYADLGVELPESSIDAGTVYFSRFYRADHAADFGFRGGFGAGLIAGVIGADAGTFSITAVVDKNDRELRQHLNDSARFDATMRLLPELADVAAASGVPIHPVHCMTGLVNRRREFTTSDGEPRIAGVVACGDVHTCTNPAYGRGMSLALRQATLIADSITEARDLIDLSRRYEAECEETVAPWYRFSLLTDQMRTMATGDGLSSAPDGDGLLGLMAGAGSDPELMRAALRVLNLLDLPEVLLASLPELQARVQLLPRPHERGARPRRHGPTREQLLAVVA